jgi:hypothetical protein
MSSFAEFAYSEDSVPSLPPLQESPAYQRFIRGPQTELAKLLCLLERFRGTELGVVFAGATYDANTAVQHGRTYLIKTYHDESADQWLKVHVKAGPDGRPIYVKSSDGKRRPAGDLLLEELAVLNNAANGAKA